MKKILILLLLLFSFTLTSCFNGKEGEDVEKEYTIQYIDDYGEHKIAVKSGEAYSLDVLPEKQGYVFTGLYDAEVGGTQYVNSNGSAVSVFTDNKNLILFPQFKPKEYTLVLDYQGASVIGERSIKVEYGDSIGELPMNLTLENKDFKGWFTKPNREGIQVADEYGVIPMASQVTEEIFDLTDSRGYIQLYAGFKGKEYTVTFYASSSSQAEEMKVEHGTPISEVVPTTRINGQAVLSWSKFKDGGEVFNGKVTDNMTLYAVEYAPVIELDSNGGEEVTPVVARAGDTIALPTPTKELAKFSYWEDMSGNKYTSTTMPEKSISLKAVWQAKLVFDENGGSDVDDISAKAGTNITLPMPTKEGFIFAGWYTSEKEQYTSTTMPSTGISLKAGWYKEQKITITQCSGDSELGYFDNTSVALKNGLTLDFSAYLPESFSGNVKIEAYLNIKSARASLSSKKTMTLYFYSTGIVSDNYLLYNKTFEITSSSYARYDFSFTTNITGNKIYCAEKVSDFYSNVYISDYYYKLIYPDTTTLYL